MATIDPMGQLFDPNLMAQYRALLEPPQEAKRAAGMDALLALGLGLLGNRSPYLGVAIGNAGVGAMGAYKSGMDTARANRMGEIQGAMGLRKLQKDIEQEARRKELVGKISDPTERLYFEADPEAYVKAKMEALKPTDIERLGRVGGFTPEELSKAARVKGGLEPEPKALGKSTLGELWAEFHSYPVGSPERASIMRRIEKEETHAPGASVSVGLQSPIMLQNPDGTYAFIQPANKPGFPPQVTPLPTGAKPAAEAKPPTAEQAQASGYALRMQRAEEIMGDLGRKGESGKPSVGEIVAGRTPFVGGPIAENAARSESRQLYRQAQEDWVRAKLRKESGAVISDPEMEREINTYFPQPFDSAGVIAQKRMARATALEAMNMATGAGAQRTQAPQGQSLQEAARQELKRRQQGGR